MKKYYLVISPETLRDTLVSESKRLMKDIYGKEVGNIYYRVKTKDQLENPRRLFIKGDGRVLEAEVEPHIALVHNLELEDVDSFVKQAKGICNRYSVFSLEYLGVGNYDMDFTFFVKYKSIVALEKLRLELLELSKPFLSDDEYKQHIDVNYVPHATVLYDDMDPEKVSGAYKQLEAKKFEKSVPITEILLWKTSVMVLPVF